MKSKRSWTEAFRPKDHGAQVMDLSYIEVGVYPDGTVLLRGDRAVVAGLMKALASRGFKIAWRCFSPCG